MRNKSSIVFVVCAALAAVLPLAAQEPPAPAAAPPAEGSWTPAQILWLMHEDVKPGRGQLHAAVEQQLAALWTKAGTTPYFALEALTGNAMEVVFVSVYQSWEGVDKDMEAYGKIASGPAYAALAKQEADFVTGMMGVLAAYRGDLSYRAEQLVRGLPNARYLVVTKYHARPGRAEAFADYQKTLVRTHADANLDQPWLTYQIQAGAPAGTFLRIQPLRSLAEITGLEAMDKTYRDALSAEVKQELARHAAEDLAVVERDVFALNTRMSRPPEGFAAAAPDFWGRGELRAPAKAMVKKAAPKPEPKKR